MLESEPKFRKSQAFIIFQGKKDWQGLFTEFFSEILTISVPISNSTLLKNDIL